MCSVHWLNCSLLAVSVAATVPLAQAIRRARLLPLRKWPIVVRLNLLPSHLNDDPAKFQAPVQRREPEFSFPEQAAFRAALAEPGSIVSPAMPHAPAHRASHCVLRTHQQDSPARAQDARQFAQSRTRIGQMFQYPAADNRIELMVAEWELREVRHSVADAAAG